MTSENENAPELTEAEAAEEARRARVVAAMCSVPDDYLAEPVTLEDFLIVLVWRLRKAGVLTCYVTAAGSGDDGSIESPGFTFKEGADDSDEVVEQLSEELDDLWEPMFDRYPFNWTDGDGGELTLHVDTVTGECSWEASAPVMTVLDEYSNTLTVQDDKVVGGFDYLEGAQPDDAVAPCDE